MLASSPLQDAQGRRTQGSADAADELVIDWLKHYLGDLLNMDAQSVDVDAPFNRYGLDSSAAVGLTGDLSTWLGRPVDAAMTYDYPTIRHLTAALLAEPATLQVVQSKLLIS